MSLEDQTDAFDADTAAYDYLNPIYKSPWTAADFPPLAEWAAENKSPLDLLIDAAARPRFFSPPPNVLENPEVPVVQMLLPHAQAIRAAARSLAARAALHAGNKEYAAAWQDCLACWRLGAHAASGPTIVERLVAMAVRHVAKDCTLMILQCDDLPESLARQILNDLNSLGPTIPIADALDQGERFFFLDYALRQFTGRLGGLPPSDYLGHFENSMNRTASVFAFDVDVPLRMGNEWYDRIVAAVRIFDRPSRKKELARIDADLEKLGEKFGPAAAGKMLFRKQRSETMGKVLLGFFLPAITAAADAQDRDETNLMLVRLSAALAVHRARTGAYPKSLDKLTPGIIAKVPLDPYSMAPLRYERRGDGYLLYSVFQNGIDNGGLDVIGEISGGEWLPADQTVPSSNDVSDLVVRMPRPPRKAPVSKEAP
jgi:hypothetical protein